MRAQVSLQSPPLVIRERNFTTHSILLSSPKRGTGVTMIFLLLTFRIRIKNKRALQLKSIPNPYAAASYKSSSGIAFKILKRGRFNFSKIRTFPIFHFHILIFYWIFSMTGLPAMSPGEVISASPICGTISRPPASKAR